MQTIVNYIHIHIYSDYKVDELSFLLVYIIGLEYFLTKISACSTDYEACDSFASLTRHQASYSGSAG
jgi:hypothetical protein